MTTSNITLTLTSVKKPFITNPTQTVEIFRASIDIELGEQTLSLEARNVEIDGPGYAPSACFDAMNKLQDKLWAARAALVLFAGDADLGIQAQAILDAIDAITTLKFKVFDKELAEQLPQFDDDRVFVKNIAA